MTTITLWKHADGRLFLGTAEDLAELEEYNEDAADDWTEVGFDEVSPVIVSSPLNADPTALRIAVRGVYSNTGNLVGDPASNRVLHGVLVGADKDGDPVVAIDPADGGYVGPVDLGDFDVVRVDES